MSLLNDSKNECISSNKCFHSLSKLYIFNFFQVIGIFCMSLATPGYTGTGFFLFVVISSFILTLIWIFVYFLGVREALTFPINWILTVSTSSPIILHRVEETQWLLRKNEKKKKIQNNSCKGLAVIHFGLISFFLLLNYSYYVINHF